jgi:hypothetical protein
MNPSSVPDDRFNEVLALIQSARQQAMQAVNTQLIELYWQVGAYISRKLEKAEWAILWSVSWRNIWLRLNLGCADLPGRMCSACANSM